MEKIAVVGLNQIVRITKKSPYFGEKGKIVSLPNKENSDYGIQFIDSLNTFFLPREDFMVLNPTCYRLF